MAAQSPRDDASIHFNATQPELTAIIQAFARIWRLVLCSDMTLEMPMHKAELDAEVSVDATPEGLRNAVMRSVVVKESDDA